MKRHVYFADHRRLVRERRMAERKTTPYLTLIASERAAGSSHRAIARRLGEEHGLKVSHEWVRQALLQSDVAS